MQNIRLLNTVYEDVPAVELPKEGGGTARFDDTSDANATASDIVSGKTAYVNGSKLTGTHVLPTGSLSITSNDTYDVTDYASATVNVPNGILVTEETDSGGGIIKHITGTVISGTTNITQNGTYDVSSYASAVVNTPVGVSIDDIATRNISGDIVVTANSIATNSFSSCSGITSFIATNATSVSATSINSVPASLIYLPECTWLGSNQGVGANNGILAIPKLTSAIGSDGLRTLYATYVDLGKTTEIGTRGLYQGNGKKVIILRKTDGLVTLSATSALTIANPCNVYVPSSLKSQYATATNWSNYSSIVWNDLEGSIYEDEDWPLQQGA